MSNINRKIIIAYLKENKVFFDKEYGVTKIALFGSYARGEEHENSDIDLLIEMQPLSLNNWDLLHEHLEKSFNRKIDLGFLDSVRAVIRKNIEKELIYA